MYTTLVSLGVIHGVIQLNAIGFPDMCCRHKCSVANPVLNTITARMQLRQATHYAHIFRALLHSPSPFIADHTELIYLTTLLSP